MHANFLFDMFIYIHHNKDVWFFLQLKVLRKCMALFFFAMNLMFGLVNFMIERTRIAAIRTDDMLIFFFACSQFSSSCIELLLKHHSILRFLFFNSLRASKFHDGIFFKDTAIWILRHYVQIILVHRSCFCPKERKKIRCSRNCLSELNVCLIHFFICSTIEEVIAKYAQLTPQERAKR